MRRNGGPLAASQHNGAVAGQGGPLRLGVRSFCHQRPPNRSEGDHDD